jgi:uncharacterized protein (UPF0332 family)
VFNTELSRRLHNAFALRQRSDYAAQIQLSNEEASQVLEGARKFVDEVKKNLIEHGFR